VKLAEFRLQIWQARHVPVIAVTALGALFVVLFIYAGSARALSDTSAPLDKKLFTSAEEERIRSGLRNPDSARFRNESVTADGTGAMLCGQINFKNATGGYEGFQRFISGRSTLLLEGSVNPGVMSKQWTKWCGRER
jgi:hypothetical protein